MGGECELVCMMSVEYGNTVCMSFELKLEGVKFARFGAIQKVRRLKGGRGTPKSVRKRTGEGGSTRRRTYACNFFKRLF